MAVYTRIGAERMARLIEAFDVGALISAKGIAEGVSNSNWLIETQQGRYILTAYEQRTDTRDLPFFLGLLDHLAAAGCPVPRTIHDRDGAAFRTFHADNGAEKVVALIEFLPGVSADQPTPAQARAVGAALAGVHLSAQDFPMRRANAMGPNDWRTLAAGCAGRWHEIDPVLATHVPPALEAIIAEWPRALPRSAIHADLFPDNVLLVGDEIAGLIDFYFACTDAMAYDLAVTHASWAFDAGGHGFDPRLGGALVAGYESVRPLDARERQALPLLAQGASLRFLLTRAYDWIHTPGDALVTRKDPLAFLRRLRFYAQAGDTAFTSA